jgi:ABC-type siderophore export system fused ATPase/permease subunit
MDAIGTDQLMDDILKINYVKDTVEKTLSKGQQKRLALILALLEKKEIIVMDEWAAEQDPQFRKYFYRNILPALKADGKTLILISHDDQYFDCADRVLKFEYGKIVEPTESSLEYGTQI